MPCQALRPGGLALTMRALQHCSFAPHAILLDVGCGYGQTRDFLRQQGFTAYGLDLHEFNTNKDIQAHATNLPLRNKSIDGIIAECVLSLMPSMEKTVAEWTRVCRQGATLLLHDVYDKRQNTVTAQSLHPLQLETTLQIYGWHIYHTEDCSSALKAYAAQLLWHGVDTLCLNDTSAQHKGYGLWIAQKIPC